MIRSTILLFAFASFCVNSSFAEEATELSYARDVRPILSKNCFQCHGPDDKTREADLRLDDAESAYSTDDRDPAIVPGKSTESELIARITSDDEFLKMPPRTRRERSRLSK